MLKYRVLGAILFLIATFCNSEAQNVLRLGDIEINQGEKSAELLVELSNQSLITGFQCDLYLPEGVEVASDEYGDYLISLERTTAKRHTISTMMQSDCSLRILCTSMTNLTFTGNEGVVLRISLDISDISAGKYSLQLKNIVLSDPEANRYVSSDVEAYLSVNEIIITPLDVVSVSPANGAEIESPSTITLTFAEAVTVNAEAGELTMVNTGDPNYDKAKNFNVTISEDGLTATITSEPGYLDCWATNATYKLNIPAGYFVGASGAVSEALEYSWKVVPARFTYTAVTPAQGDVENLETIFIDFGGFRPRVIDGYTYPTYNLVNANGETVTTAATNYTYEKIGDSYYYKLKVTLGAKVTTPGDYFLTIPAGVFKDKDVFSGYNENAEMTFKWTIVASNPNSYTLALNADPASGSTVSALDKITFTPGAGVIMFMATDEAKAANWAKVTDANGNSYNSKIDLSGQYWVLTIDNAVEPGIYTVVIPKESFFDAKNQTNYNPEIILKYTLKAKTLAIPTVNPANVTEVESLNTITLTFAEAVTANAEAGAITIVNTSDPNYDYAKNIAVTMSEDGLTATITCQPGYPSEDPRWTSNATYKLKIPTGYFIAASGAVSNTLEYSWKVVATYPTSFVLDGITYNVTSHFNLAVELANGKNYSGDIVVSSAVTFGGKTYSVTSIGEKAFHGCSNLTSIVIPNSVTSIANRAFLSCGNLKSVVIPNSVTSIGVYTFAYCGNLTSVNIPIGVTIIGDGAFSNCNSLTSIDIPENVTIIGESAFSNCSSLTSIDIQGSVTSIQKYTFYQCNSLISIEIPNSVTSIGERAFFNCSSLASVEIPNNVIGIGERAFLDCSSLISIYIPDSVTSIGEGAFEGCSNMESFTIGNGITRIEERTFYECQKLKSVVISNNVTSIGEYAFAYAHPALTSIELPSSITCIENNAFYYCYSLKEITCNAINPPTIYESTFVNYSANLYVPIGSGSRYRNADYWKKFNVVQTPKLEVTSVIPADGDIATSLNSITIVFPESVTVNEAVGTISLGNVDNLNDFATNCTVAISEDGCTVTISSQPCFPTGNPRWTIGAIYKLSIPAGYFTGASGAGNKVIEYSWKVVAESAKLFIIDGITYSITSSDELTAELVGGRNYKGALVIPSAVNYEGKIYSVTSIGDNAFRDCKGLTSVEVSENVKRIGNKVFSNCGSLKSVDIPNSVTSIGDRAFYECSSLSSIVIGEGVTRIGANAFYGCSSLKTIDIPVGVTEIREYTFYNCSSLTSIKIPSSVTSIQKSAFSGCSGLTSISIPNGVSSIGNYAFYDCSSLTSVVIPNKVTSIGSNAFWLCKELKEITCYTANPPTISKDTFYDYSATLYVPFGWESAYKSAEYWKNFNITQLPQLPQIEVVSVTPTNGAVVESLNTIILTFAETVTANAEAGDITLVNTGDPNYDYAKNFNVTMSEDGLTATITCEPGYPNDNPRWSSNVNYKLNIPAGYFVATTGATSNTIKYSWTIAAPVIEDYTPVVSPAAGNITVDQMNETVITFESPIASFDDSDVRYIKPIGNVWCMYAGTWTISEDKLSLTINWDFSPEVGLDYTLELPAGCIVLENGAKNLFTQVKYTVVGGPKDLAEFVVPEGINGYINYDETDVNAWAPEFPFTVSTSAINTIQFTAELPSLPAGITAMEVIDENGEVIAILNQDGVAPLVDSEIYYVKGETTKEYADGAELKFRFRFTHLGVSETIQFSYIVAGGNITSIADVELDGNVIVRGNDIIAPQGVAIFTVSGICVPAEGLAPGIYVVVLGNQAVKVMVK